MIYREIREITIYTESERASERDENKTESKRKVERESTIDG